MKFHKNKRFHTVESYAACICTNATCSCYCYCICGCPGGTSDRAIDSAVISYSEDVSSDNFVTGTPSQNIQI